MDSLEKGKKILAKELKQYDFVKELFPNLERFYKMYVEFDCQLKPKDKLEVKVETISADLKHSGEIKTPVIRLYLVNKKGKSKWIGSYDYTGIMQSKHLYSKFT